MKNISLVKHAPTAPGLRFFGIGPKLLPCNGLIKLQNFLEEHAFWAGKRSKYQLRQMLSNSSVIISLWRDGRIVGFGRATSDSIFRAVLWDVVVADDFQRHGLGSLLVEALLQAPSIKNVEKVYLMTTNSSKFYKQMGFENSFNQSLLIIKNN